MLLVVALCASVLCGFQMWRWWKNTLHMRRFHYAVSESSLDTNTKAIYQRLAWSPAAWKSGLIQQLCGPATIKRIVWKGKTRCGFDVYIFDAFIYPAAHDPIPPICILINQNQDVLAWKEMGMYSRGFIRATLNKDDILTITTAANWTLGKGIYNFAIKDGLITPMGDVTFEKYGEQNPQTPKLAPGLPLIDQAVRQYESI